MKILIVKITKTLIFLINFLTSTQIKSFDEQLLSGQFYHDNSIKIIRNEIVNKSFRLEGRINKFGI